MNLLALNTTKNAIERLKIRDLNQNRLKPKNWLYYFVSNANFRAAVWFLAGMQLHWFLNQNCNLGLYWTNHKLRTNVNSTRFCRLFLLNEMVCFVQNGAVSCSVHEKKEKEKGETVSFWRHCRSSSSPGCVKQGKKKIFLPLSPPSLPSKRRWLPFKKTSTNPTCQKETFHMCGGVVEGWQHSGRLSHVSPLFLPIKTGEEKKKNETRERERRAERGKKGEERGQSRKERKEEEKRKEKEEKGRGRRRSSTTVHHAPSHR